MGAAVMMRDDSLDAEITDDAIAGRSTYYSEALKKETARLAELLAMNVDQAEVLAQADFDAAIASREKTIAREQEHVRRYRDMRAKAVAWEPPTPEHIGLKQFMIQQIDESTKYGPYTPEMPVKLPARQWLVQEIDKISKSIERHAQYMGEDYARAKERIEWINAIRRVTPQPK
jgi:hypothetical protein